MSWSNHQAVMAQLLAAGLIIDKPLDTSGRIQRWLVDREGHEKRGWTRLREWRSKDGAIYLTGLFGIWRGTDDGRINIELEFEKNSADYAAIREANKIAQRELEKTRRAETKTAGAWAAAVWHHATPATEHDYCTAKQIAAHGLRILGDLSGIELPGIDDSNFYRLKAAAGALVVPMHDTRGSIAGLQFVYGKGHPRRVKLERDKEFWPSGMAVGGNFGLIGPVLRDGLLLIAEGYATAATLHECTGLSVAYAFSANNLIKAGKQIRAAWPQLRILFCADDDYLTDGNPGMAAASAATAAIERTSWLAPDFTDEAGKDRRNGKKLTDFNDLFVMDGVGIGIANQINAKLDALKWRTSGAGFVPASGAGLREQGDGEGGKIPLQAQITINEAAERFALVYGGKGTLFDFAESALVPKADVLDILPPRAWDDLKKHPSWRAFRLSEVGFDPAGTDENIRCNLFGGWPTVPKAGNCHALLDLLEFLCSEDKNSDEILRWVLRWYAYPIQHPGAKMKTALIFHGPQGAGKNLWCESVMAIYGEYGRIVDQAAIEDKFNDWASRKLFLIADEVVARQELYHVKNKLKHFVTGDWIRINPKNVTAHDEKNHVNITFLSNEVQPLPIEKDDRRHIVIWTPQAANEEFYAAVRDEINAGGIAALHHHLLHLDLGDFNEHTKPPMTAAKQDLIARSLTPQQAFIEDWQRGDIYLDAAGRDVLPFCPCLGSDLFEAYRKYCTKNGIQYPGDISKLIGTLKKLPGWSAGESVLTYVSLTDRIRKSRKMVLPSPDALAAAEKTQTAPTCPQRASGNQAEWLTESFFMFSNALRNAL